MRRSNEMHRADLNIADMHSHILPALDDGASDAEISVQMLKMSAEQGVSRIVATPHFYPEKESPDEFLSRRSASVEMLLPHLHSGLPSVYVGAEVAYFIGIGRSQDMKRLCIADTKYIMVEMPFERWSDSVIENLIAMKTVLGLSPIIAHIERYILQQPRKTLEALAQAGILIQANSEFFTSRKTARRARSLLSRGLIHLLGSDCHSTECRAPNIGSALKALEGVAAAEELDFVSDMVLADATPIFSGEN